MNDLGKPFDKDEIGQRLADVRRMARMSQEEMAKALSISTSGYRNYEKGERSLPARLASQICKQFSVDIVWLLDGLGVAPHLGKRSNQSVLWAEALLLVEQHLASTGQICSPKAKVTIVELVVSRMMDSAGDIDQYVATLVDLAA